MHPWVSALCVSMVRTRAPAMKKRSRSSRSPQEGIIARLTFPHQLVWGRSIKRRRGPRRNRNGRIFLPRRTEQALFPSSFCSFKEPREHKESACTYARDLYSLVNAHSRTEVNPETNFSFLRVEWDGKIGKMSVWIPLSQSLWNGQLPVSRLLCRWRRTGSLLEVSSNTTLYLNWKVIRFLILTWILLN